MDCVSPGFPSHGICTQDERLLFKIHASLKDTPITIMSDVTMDDKWKEQMKELPSPPSLLSCAGSNVMDMLAYTLASSVTDKQSLAKAAMEKCAKAPHLAAKLYKRGELSPSVTAVPLFCSCMFAATPQMALLQDACQASRVEEELMELMGWLPQDLPVEPIQDSGLYSILHTLAVRIGPDPYDPETSGQLDLNDCSQWCNKTWPDKSTWMRVFQAFLMLCNVIIMAEKRCVGLVVKMYDIVHSYVQRTQEYKRPEPLSARPSRHWQEHLY